MKKILFLICLFSVSFYSCAIRNAISPTTRGLDAERTFYGQMINNGKTVGWFNIKSKLLTTSDHLAIYIQTKFSNTYTGPKDIGIYGLNKMVQEFEYYYDDMTNIYGGHSDVDGNGKIIILLMDINVPSSTGSKTLGYFNPLDMHGYNEGEILYMDLSNANSDIYKSIGTLIHEFQHLINYNYVASGKRREMDSWLNESLSESTSILFDKATVKSRIGEFNGMNYYCFYTWDIPTNVSNNGIRNNLVNYPSASVFMNWLYQTNGNKSDIFKNIAQSTENSDWNKVLTAAKQISGLSGVSSWEDLLLTWMSEVVSNGITSEGVKATNNMASGNINLYPGAMIVCSNVSSGLTNNVVSRTNTNSGKNSIIVLNKETTLNLQGYVPKNVSVTSSTTKSRARRSVENKEENQIINILLDRNGNIKKY